MGKRLKMTERGERRAMIAIVAIFALLVQAMLPSFATAAPRQAADMPICTEKGLQTAPTDPGLPSTDHVCKHCVCPVPAADSAPVISLPPAACAVQLVAAQPPADVGVPPARAPPRPPGQGPPLPNA